MTLVIDKQNVVFSNLAKPVVGKATNNVAELQACICAIKIALEHGK